MPVWHVSVSVWSRRGERLDLPVIAERAAVRLLAGVGGVDVEWWLWNPDTRVGHLRVPVTPAENDRIPPGMAVDDAGDTGPPRPRVTP